jgi:hypothetical protein
LSAPQILRMAPRVGPLSSSQVRHSCSRLNCWGSLSRRLKLRRGLRRHPSGTTAATPKPTTPTYVNVPRAGARWSHRPTTLGELSTSRRPRVSSSVAVSKPRLTGCRASAIPADEHVPEDSEELGLGVRACRELIGSLKRTRVSLLHEVLRVRAAGEVAGLGTWRAVLPSIHRARHIRVSLRPAPSYDGSDHREVMGRRPDKVDLTRERSDQNDASDMSRRAAWEALQKSEA